MQNRMPDRTVDGCRVVGQFGGTNDYRDAVFAPYGCNVRAIRAQYDVCNAPRSPGVFKGPGDHRLTGKDQSVFAGKPFTPNSCEDYDEALLTSDFQFLGRCHW